MSLPDLRYYTNIFLKDSGKKKKQWVQPVSGPMFESKTNGAS
jgi:hypothetical protein